MNNNYSRVSENHIDVGKKIMNEHRSYVVDVASSDGIFSVFTNIVLPNYPELNSICKTVDDNSDTTWGLVFDSDENDRWVLNFTENPKSAKSLYQMYGMVYDCPTVFVRKTRREDVSSDMATEPLVDLIISNCVEEPNKKELMEKFEPVLDDTDID